MYKIIHKVSDFVHLLCFRFLYGLDYHPFALLCTEMDMFYTYSDLALGYFS